METETNTPSEQVEANEEVAIESSTNAEVETVSQETEYDDAYDKAFEDMDLDNPDMSAFTEQTNVEEEPEQPVESDEIPEEQPVNNDPFALDEDGYLSRQLTDRGKEVRVTPDELFAFGSKGLNYEDRNAEMKPFKPYMKILKEQNVSVEDFKSFADFTSGKKEALKHLISKYDVDVYDVDTLEDQYTPQIEEDTSSAVGDIWSDFQATDPTGSEVVAGVFNGMNEEFRQEVHNEQTFPLFISDVKSGLFDKLYPETVKLKALNPGASWIDVYSEANRRFDMSKQKKEVPLNAIPPKDMGSGDVRVSTKIDDIWNDADAYKAFEAQMTI